jgi:hypothetical protein
VTGEENESVSRAAPVASNEEGHLEAMSAQLESAAETLQKLVDDIRHALERN